MLRSTAKIHQGGITTKRVVWEALKRDALDEITT
jgi:hypothetical protein